MKHVVRSGCARGVRERRSLKGGDGFTLVELFVTVAVMAIMATLAIPFILTASRSLTMSGGAREMQAALRQTRMLAVTTRQNICFQPVGGGYAS